MQYTNMTDEWLSDIESAFKKPEELLEYLKLDKNIFNQQARESFPMFVTKHFANLINKSDINDPLLRQVLPIEQENVVSRIFTLEPLEEQQFKVTNNILHKYINRVLFMANNSCAINCRYCFRRNFNYKDIKTSKIIWQESIDYIKNNHQIEEVILSGGDPLMLKNKDINWLLNQLEEISHIKYLRIHSRLLTVLPNRIDTDFIKLISNRRFKLIIVFHINHPNEISKEFSSKIKKISMNNITFLNQSVLLKGINDNSNILKKLSEKLFKNCIIPYYLHLLDKVSGTTHFYINDEDAKIIYQEFQSITSGYLVPKLSRETVGEKFKSIIGN